MMADKGRYKHLDFAAIDLIFMAASFVLAYRLKFGDLSFIASGPWKGLLALILLSNAILIILLEPHNGVLRRGYWADIGESLKVALLSFLWACVTFYLLKIGEVYSREMLLTTYLLYLVSTIIVKAIWKKVLLSYGKKYHNDSCVRIVLASTTDKVDEMEQLALADDMAAYEVVGFYLPDSEKGELHGKPVAGLGGLMRLARMTNADMVLVTFDPTRIDSNDYEKLAENGVRVSFAIADALGVNTETQFVSNVGIFKTLNFEYYTFGTGRLLYLQVKRIFDVLLGIIGCVVAVAVAGIVKLIYIANGDGNSIVYKQTRIGWRGKPFKMYKFRSMVWNADELLEELLRDSKLRSQWDNEQKLKDDPRITGIGKFLRKTSIDELPQFLNVLKGEMSVVGPRPLVPGELEKHEGLSLYNRVKPGMTGWWGCNGRSNIEYRERLELEYYYIKHCSLYLDLLCMLRTFVTLLKRNGAQ